MRTKRLARHFLAYLAYNLRDLGQSPPRLFAAIIGAISLFMTAREMKQKLGIWPVTITIAAIALVFTLLVLRAFNRSRATIQDHKLFYRAYSPAEDRDMAQITKACAFFGDAAISSEDGQAATESDPFSLVVLRDGEGNAIGFADFYCFSRESFDDYTSGRISVRDMFADHYLPHDKARSAPVLYVSTIFRYDFISDQSFRGRCETALLAWALAKLILTVQTFPEDGVTIYSYGDSPEGNAMLLHFGFRKSDLTDPKGNALLWCEKLQKPALETFLARYDFLGNQCHFSLTRPLI